MVLLDVANTSDWMATVTPGNPAPESSIARPWISPRVVCATATPAVAEAARIVTIKSLKNFILYLLETQKTIQKYHT
jgi:hypothetical protein